MTSNQCVTCANFLHGYAVCRAFPDGIPDDVLRGVVDHNKPVDGDHGVQRVPDPALASP